ncbi:MAG: hypothetical protein GX228_01235 [Firmicutes bacterium]|jgi:hypothetical protein|nr:hypothetical protein [Bacillota bacterium]NLL87538.1 hypothetical protein [Bacillota bacterium]HKM17195.1 hypothetical protein [Limnochordia bacterium]
MLKNGKILVVFIGLVCIVLLPSAVVQAEARFIVGYTGDDWFAGIQGEHRSRSLMGFIGYQEDVVSGLVALTNQAPKPLGYVQAGREVFLGNIKYSVEAYGGNPDFHTDLLAGNRLGIRGEYKQQTGKQAYGIAGELNLLGKPTLKLVPYLEWRSTGVLKAHLEAGTESIAVGLDYGFALSPQAQAGVFAAYDFKNKALDYGARLTFAGGTLTGAVNTETGMSLGLAWKGAECPFAAGIRWQQKVQWYASYTWKM